MSIAARQASHFALSIYTFWTSALSTNFMEMNVKGKGEGKGKGEEQLADDLDDDLSCQWP